MPFQVSPGVNVSEIDLTTGIPAVSVSTGAIAGTFNWGPIGQINPVSSEVELAEKFGAPDANTSNSFFTAAAFLSYSNDLRVVRAQGANAKNATSNSSGSLIKNTDDYFNGAYQTNVGTSAFAARYAGALGNSIEVIAWANGAAWSANSSNTSDPLYAFASQFDFAPNTTPYVSRVSNGGVTGDELHIVVIDSKGLITGQANTVLERYQGLSRLTDAAGPDGSSNYYKEVLYRKSQYIYQTGHPTNNTTMWGVTVAAANGTSANNEAGANVNFLGGGADGTVTAANTITALALYNDPDNVDISLLMVGEGSNTVINYATSIAESRKDIVVFASPSLSAVQDPTDPAGQINTFVNTLTRSSYLVVDSGWKYAYDKYNDQFRWAPLNGDIAGLCARTDNVKDPWWSPAGLQRGQIKNVTKLAFNPNKTARDTLYKNGVNSVVSFPGEGTMLYGDKTFLNYTSAFDRINVRRLFIVLEKAIARAARTSLFEFNDAFTRAQFVNMVEPFLRTVKGRRGVYDYRVVCDTTNNTPFVIDSNQFVGDIYIQPARSINFIQLNFVAVRTGVSFNEVVGNF
jgi:phage tail sheath protein FI